MCLTKREEGEENWRLIKCEGTREVENKGGREMMNERNREVENKRGREMMNESNRERLIANTNKMIARVIIR